MSDDSSISKYGHIKKDLDSINEVLEKQIISIEIKQNDLQNYVCSIDSNIKHLENLIAIEQQQKPPNLEKIRFLRGNIVKSIELLNDIYKTYKEFEETKFKYYKEIGDNKFRLHKLIELELRKIDEKTEASTEEFFELMRNLSAYMNSSKSQENSTSDSTVLFEDEPQNEKYIL